MIQRSIQIFTIFLALGMFLASCASDPNIESAKLNLKKKDYQATLESAEKAIEMDSTNALGYYYKGVAYSEMAGDMSNPAERQEYYRKMNKAFDKANELFGSMESRPNEAANLNAVKNTVWSMEHNAGVKLATSDSAKKTENYLQKAENHLKNATMVMPDSALSYSVLAEVNAMQNDVQGAIDAMSRAISLKDTASIQEYRRLSYFYQREEQYNEAAELLNEAQKIYPDNIELVQTLADVYLKLDQKDKALRVVKRLIEEDPENPQYRLVYGTQVYQSVLSLNDELSSIYDELYDLEKELENAGDDAKVKELEQTIADKEARIEELQAEIEEQTGQALEQLTKVTELRPKDDQAYHTIGVIYFNKAAAIIEEINRTKDNELAAKLDKEAKKLLKKAMNHYEKAVEINPEKQQYWRNLYQVYARLDMQEKAKEAMEKAGL